MRIGNVSAAADGARQQAAAERRVGDNLDAERAARGHDFGLDVARPHRPLLLDAVDRVHGVRAANRVGACLGQRNAARLAGGDLRGHRAHRLLDRHVLRHAAQHDNVNVVRAERLERIVDVGGNALRGGR